MHLDRPVGPAEGQITDDLEALLERLPPHLYAPLLELPERGAMLEVVMDLGRPAEVRLPEREVTLSPAEITHADLDHVIQRIGEFGDDNRAGIERTLHRVSAIRNRKGRVVGLTLRVGRAVFGTVGVIRDLVDSGKSVLLLGRPGVGKTTLLREVARVVAGELGKRVIVVDTSNEIAGDGDIPHPGIGRARRMQVATPTLQHAVMIEAVENHMPEVIVIDEIGTELEAAAARTIAERGVQLIATAHGNTLENLMLNPTLSDLIGGIQTVTLSDEEAKRRGTQKSVLERKAPPTFDLLVEIQSRDRVAVHGDVTKVVDAILRGRPIQPEVRAVEDGGVVRSAGEARVVSLRGEAPPAKIFLPEERRGRRGAWSARPREPVGPRREAALAPPEGAASQETRRVRLYPYGLSARRLGRTATEVGFPVEVVGDIEDADALVVTKEYFKENRGAIRAAENAGVPIYVLRNSSTAHIERCLHEIYGVAEEAAVTDALREAQEAIDQVLSGAEPVALAPRAAHVRKLQHRLAERHHLASRSEGREPERRVTIYP